MLKVDLKRALEIASPGDLTANMEELAEPIEPRKMAHKKSSVFVTTSAAPSSSATEGLRARQLDRLATRSKPVRQPLSVKAKTGGRDSNTTAITKDTKDAATSPRKQPHATKLPSSLRKDGLLSSAAAQRLNKKTGGGEGSTMHSRGNGSSGENKLMDETLASGKEGRSFTVGKVGGGGKIYLR